MPAFSVDSEVFTAFPNARFAAVIVRGADNTATGADIDELLRAAELGVRTMLAGVDPKSHPNIVVWREAFAARGWTPSKYLSSIEALVRRVVKGSDLPRISPVVDLGNSVSLKRLVPIGAHDLATAPQGIAVRLARPEDHFQPMGEGEPEVPDEGEIVYASGNDVRTRRWVWRQSVTSLVRPESRDILYPIDGFTPTTVDAVHAAAALLADLAPRLLGGAATVYHIDPEHPATAE